MILSRRRVAIAVAAVAAVTAATIASLTLGAPAGAVPGCAATPDYAHTIPGPIGGPAAAPANGAAVYATIGGDRKTYVTTATFADEDLAVGELVCLGGGAVDTPAVTLWGDGLAFFVLAPNGRIYQKYVADGGPIDGPWSTVPGAPVGGGAPAVAVSEEDGSLNLFVRGANGRLSHGYRNVGNDAQLWAWEDLGGGMTGTAGAAPIGGGFVVVVRAPNGRIYRRSGVTGNWGGPWAQQAGTTSASPVLAAGYEGGRVDLFVTGTTGGLYQSRLGIEFDRFVKVRPELPVRSKLAAVAAPGAIAVWATATVDGVTGVGFTRYRPGFGWSEFDAATYTCDECLPVEVAGTTGTRAAQQRSIW